MAFSKYPSSTWSVKARYSLGNRSSAGRGGLGVNGLRLGVEAGFAGGAIINQAHKGCAPNSNLDETRPSRPYYIKRIDTKWQGVTQLSVSQLNFLNQSH